MRVHLPKRRHCDEPGECIRNSSLSHAFERPLSKIFALSVGRLTCEGAKVEWGAQLK